MTKEQKSILVAIAIGDGHISKIKRDSGKIYCGMHIKHKESHKEYVQYKANIINSICGGKQNPIRKVSNNGHKAYQYAKTNSYFRCIRGWLYKNNNKVLSRKLLDKLNPQGLAIWWMDDGCLYSKKRNGKIHAWELYLNLYVSKEEAEIVQLYFKEVWNVNWKLNRDGQHYRLRCSTREGRKFLDIVRPYVSQVKCMQYKAQII